MTDPSSRAAARLRRSRESRSHGWFRRTDPAGRRASSQDGAAGLGRRAGGGTAMLLSGAIAVFAAIGLARVHTRIHVLAIGRDIADLTTEQAELLDHKRRLLAERAYLRRPDRLRAAASERLGMKPAVAAEIRVLEAELDAPTDTEAKEPGA